MPCPAILYVSPRFRGAMTEKHADALDYLTRRLGPMAISLPTPLPRRIAETPLTDYEAVPAWMIGATAAQAHRGL